MGVGRCFLVDWEGGERGGVRVARGGVLGGVRVRFRTVIWMVGLVGE